MKQKNILFIVFLLFAKTAWTQAFTEEKIKKPIQFKQNAEFSIKINTLQDYEPSWFSASGMYNIMAPRFSAGGGVFLEKGDSQLTLFASYNFLKRKKISLGTGVIYNLNWLHDYSLSNNFLPCFNLEWQPKPFYKLNFSIDLLFKFRHLFIFGFNHHSLVNTTLAIDIKNTFYLPKNFLIYLEFASIEKFRYMIFCAPSYILGMEYKINDSFDLAFDVTVHYIDFFTLSAHYADTDIRLGGRYKW